MVTKGLVTVLTLLLFITTPDARAEGPRDPFEPVVTWSPAGSTQTLQVRVRPEVQVTVTFRAVLAELEHSWSQGPYTIAPDGAVDIPIETPPEAWLHEASRDYVTDLIVTVSADLRRVRAPQAFLAWPDGRDGGGRIWTVAQQLALAANGVHRAELRQGIEDPNGRLLPDVSDVVPPQAPAPVQDTGMVQP